MTKTTTGEPTMTHFQIPLTMKFYNNYKWEPVADAQRLTALQGFRLALELADWVSEPITVLAWNSYRQDWVSIGTIYPRDIDRSLIESMVAYKYGW